MNQKMKGLLFIGLFMSLLICFLPKVTAYGDTGLKTGQRLIYDVSLVRTQQWTMNGTWYNTTVGPRGNVPHINNFYNESRTRKILGTITVDILEVRIYTVALRISYDLHSYQDFLDRSINDSLPKDDYVGKWNQTKYPKGPNINETLTIQWLNITDSFELEVNKLTRNITLITKYNLSVALTPSLYNLITTSPSDYCSFWIYPDSKEGEFYKMSHIGVFTEMTGDYDNFIPTSTSQAPLKYEIVGAKLYSAPPGGAGDNQWAWRASYKIQPNKTGPPHKHILDYNSYVNEFIFDQDTGILLQYRRTYRILPYGIIGILTRPLNKSISATDLYNLEFTMTLNAGSNVDLGLSNTTVILLWIFIPVGIVVAVIVVIFFIRRRH